MADDSFFDKLIAHPKFRPFMLKVAFVGAILTVTGGFLKITLSDDYGLLVVGMGMLAIVSFLLPAMYPQRNDSELETAVRVWWLFAIRLTGWGLSVLLLGLLFYVSHWPNSKSMLVIGGGVVAFSLLAWFWYFHNRNTHKNYFHRRNTHKNIDTFK